MRPLNGHVLLNIEIEEGKERKTEGGIIIPGTVDKDDITNVMPTGIVLSAANDVMLDLKAGDAVLYNNFSGKEVMVDDVHCLLIKSEDLYAVK